MVEKDRDKEIGKGGPEEVIGVVLIYLKSGCVVACHMGEVMKAHDGVM